MPIGTMEIFTIVLLIGLPVGGIVLFLWFIKAGAKAYNKGKLEAEAEHKDTQDKSA